MIYANCDMNPIQGERFQDLCETQISKIEHKDLNFLILSDCIFCSSIKSLSLETLII